MEKSTTWWDFLKNMSNVSNMEGQPKGGISFQRFTIGLAKLKSGQSFKSTPKHSGFESTTNHKDLTSSHPLLHEHANVMHMPHTEADNEEVEMRNAPTKLAEEIRRNDKQLDKPSLAPQPQRDIADRSEQSTLHGILSSTNTKKIRKKDNLLLNETIQANSKLRTKGSNLLEKISNERKFPPKVHRTVASLQRGSQERKRYDTWRFLDNYNRHSQNSDYSLFYGKNQRELGTQLVEWQQNELMLSSRYASSYLFDEYGYPFMRRTSVSATGKVNHSIEQ